jgi:hypothetical protein
LTRLSTCPIPRRSRSDAGRTRRSSAGDFSRTVGGGIASGSDGPRQSVGPIAVMVAARPADVDAPDRLDAHPRTTMPRRPGDPVPRGDPPGVPPGHRDLPAEAAKQSVEHPRKQGLHLLSWTASSGCKRCEQPAGEFPQVREFRNRKPAAPPRPAPQVLVKKGVDCGPGVSCYRPRGGLRYASDQGLTVPADTAAASAPTNLSRSDGVSGLLASGKRRVARRWGVRRDVRWASTT